MLVLTRKQNEKIRIGNDIIINVLSISENHIKIGIEAPTDIKILREELYENVKQNTVEASKRSIHKLDTDLSKLSVNKLNKR